VVSLFAPFRVSAVVPGFLPVEGSVITFVASAATTPDRGALDVGGLWRCPPPPETVSRLGRVAEHPLTQSCLEAAWSTLGLLKGASGFERSSKIALAITP
jgi:hypothetical protein